MKLEDVVRLVRDLENAERNCQRNMDKHRLRQAEIAKMKKLLYNSVMDGVRENVPEGLVMDLARELAAARRNREAMDRNERNAEVAKTHIKHVLKLED